MSVTNEIMTQLRKSPGTPREIAAELGMSTNYDVRKISATLCGLEKKGLVSCVTRSQVREIKGGKKIKLYAIPSHFRKASGLELSRSTTP